MTEAMFDFKDICTRQEMQNKLLLENLAEREYCRFNILDHAMRDALYDRIAQDVNDSIRENGLDILGQPGSSIPVTTSVCTRFDDIPLVVLLRREDKNNWLVRFHDTPFSQFAFSSPGRMSYPYPQLLSIANKRKQDFEKFFNESCTRELLDALCGSQADNILLPAGCLDRSGVYPVFVQFSRNQRAACPPYVLGFFCRSMASREASRAKEIFIGERYVDDAKKRSSLPDIPDQIEKALASLPQEKWERLLDEARRTSTVPAEIYWAGGAFSLVLRSNRWCVVREFGTDESGAPYRVPSVMLYLYEKHIAGKSQAAISSDRQSDIRRELVEQEVEWHADLPADLAALIGVESTQIDIAHLLSEQNVEALFRQSRSAPVWFKTSLRSGVHDIYGRIDYNPLSRRSYALRCFSPLPPAHPLNRFATYFVAPFADLWNMLNSNMVKPDGRTITELIVEFASMFEEKAGKNINSHLPLPNPHVYEPNTAYCADTCFTMPETEQQKISVYFGSCAYYKGQDTPYFLKFFYLEEPLRKKHVGSKEQRAIEYLIIGDKIQDWRRYNPNPLAAIKYFNRQDRAPAEREMFDYLMLLQKKSDIIKLRYLISERKNQNQQEDLLRKLLHQIRHSTIAVQSLSNDIKRTGNTAYVDRIIKHVLSLNKSVELFRYTTSDKDELRAKFNESLLRRSGPGEFGTGDDASLSFTNLLARAISEALDTLLDPASEERFRPETTAYLNARFLPEAWVSATELERQAALSDYKKILISRHPKEQAAIQAETLDSLDPADAAAMQTAWALKRLRSECDLHRESPELSRMKAILEKYFFSSVTLSKTNVTFFKPSEALAQFLLADILVEALFNVLKYGDPSGVLKLIWLHQPDRFTLYIENAISPKRRSQGSGSGLKGCNGLVGMLGGALEFKAVPHQTDERSESMIFVVRMDIPLTSVEGVSPAPVITEQI